MWGCNAVSVSKVVLVGLAAGAVAVGVAAQAGASPSTTTSVHGGFNSRVDLAHSDFRSSTHAMTPYDNTWGTWRQPAYMKGPITVARPQGVS